jgi:1-phosphofructokinase
MNSKVATITLNPAVDQTVAIPNFKTGAVNRVEWEQRHPGGKGVNVASFLADLGVSVTVTGFLGQAEQEWFQQFFDQKGIHNCFVSVPGKTRVNVKIIDSVQQQITDINFPGQKPNDNDINQLDHILDALMPFCSWFVLSGSLPSGLSFDFYNSIITRLKAENKTVVLDTSGASLRQAISLAPDVIKPNIEELQTLLGRLLEGDRAIIAAAQDLLAQGIKCVVVSRGAQGAIFVEADQVITACPPPMEVVSTVGAGDALVAGLVAGKLRKLPLSDCARLAIACSMGILTQVGSQLPSQETLDALADQVNVTPQLQMIV